MLPEGEGDTDGPGRPKKPFGDGFGPAGASPPAAFRPHPLTPVPNTEAGRASVRLRASPSAEPEKTLAASGYTPQPGWGVDGDPGADLAHNAAPAPAGEPKGLGQAGPPRPSRWRQGASGPWNPRAAGQWLPALVTCLPSGAPGAERGGLPGGNEASAPAGRLP